MTTFDLFIDSKIKTLASVAYFDEYITKMIKIKINKEK